MKRHTLLRILWIVVALGVVVVAVWLVNSNLRPRRFMSASASVTYCQAQRPKSADDVRQSHPSCPMGEASSPITGARVVATKSQETHLAVHSNNTEKTNRAKFAAERRSAQESHIEASLNPAIVQASIEFKQNAGLGLRPRPARILLPHLKKGMSKAEVKDLLGEPSRVSDDGLFWGYIVFYSQFIDVYFDSHAKIRHIEACVSTNASDGDIEATRGE